MPRFQVMNFVAQFRVVQRLIMACTVIWITVVMYKTGILSSLASQITLHKEAELVVPNFNVNDSRLSEEVRSMLNNTQLKPIVALVLDQVRYGRPHPPPPTLHLSIGTFISVYSQVAHFNYWRFDSKVIVGVNQHFI